MEVLAPAGSIEAFKAAIYNGADAIYCGLKTFNARRLAKNFSSEELHEAVQLAHIHGVKVYVTMNTLVRNNELSMWISTIKKAYEAGVDSLIVQDMALANYLSKHLDIEIHASTQCSFMNHHAISNLPFFHTYVLARELKKDELINIRKHTKKHLEIFVHGHLCSSYSGQCLISSLIGARSGNRGVCASSCRKKYNNKGYLISAKDLFLAPHTKDLKEIGVNTLKIEGRMKSAEYVGLTTATYRAQVDQAMQNKNREVPTKELHQLRMSFNRDFTSGFAFKDDIIGTSMPMNRGELLGTISYGSLELKHPLQEFDGVGFWNKADNKMDGMIIHHVYKDGKKITHAKKGDIIKIPSSKARNGIQVFLTSKSDGNNPIHTKKLVNIDATFTATKDNPITLTYNDKTFQTSINSQEAKTQGLTDETIVTEFDKSKHLEINWNLHIIKDDNIFIPKSELNKLRHQAEESLMQKKKTIDLAIPEVKPKKANKNLLIVKVYNEKDFNIADNQKVDIIYYDVFSKDIEYLKPRNAKLYLDTPVVLSDKDIKEIEKIIKRVKPDGVVIGNWGLLHLDIPKHGKYSLNTFNDLDMQFLQDHNTTPMFSVELSGKQVKQFQNKDGIYYAHGRLPVMHFKGEMKEHSLTDEKGYTFPLRNVNHNTEMLYSRPIATLEHVQELQEWGVKKFLLDIEENAQQLIETYRALLNGEKPNTSMLKQGTTIKPFLQGVG